MANEEQVVLTYHGEDSPRGKIWKCRIDSEGQGGLWIEYGAIGSSLRSAYVPVSRFSGSTAAEEQRFRVTKKLTLGYKVDDSVQKTPKEAVVKTRPKVEVPPPKVMPKQTSAVLGDWFF